MFYTGRICTGALALQISHLPAVWEHDLLKAQDVRVFGSMTTGSDDVAWLERTLFSQSSGRTVLHPDSGKIGCAARSRGVYRLGWLCGLSECRRRTTHRAASARVMLREWFRISKLLA